MKKVLFSLLAVATLLFTACNDDDNKDDNNSDDRTLNTQDINSGENKVLNGDYILNGTLSVKDGGILTIEAGTKIVANEGFGKYIIVERGGQIYVKGTAAEPVSMVGKVEEAGYWGGLIINGKAPISGAYAEGQNEGLTEVNANLAYGGNVEADNSGSITYLILGQTGAKSSASVEHNGLTLNAVGSGTTIENIYVYQGADDAVEFFGGSVNVKNFLSVDSDDDMFDVTQGWKGTLTNAYGVWSSSHLSTESDPRGVESDGNLDGEGPDHTRQSDFTITNLTIVHNGDAAQVEAGALMHDVIKVRRGAKATISNALVKGAGVAKDLIDLTDKKGNAADGTSISISNELTEDLTGEAQNVGDVSATITVEAGNTGCDASLFSWTGYSL